MTLPQIKRENHWKDSAMEIDQPLNPLADTRIRPSSKANLLEDTRTHPSSNTNKDEDLEVITHKDTKDVTLLTKPEKIQCLVKEHVAIRDKFLQARKVNDTLKMKTMLFKAQESQKSLQKLIPNKEVESYVEGWNPWEIKKKLYPPPPKGKQDDKPRSLTSKKMRYDDRDIWSKVADIASAVRSLYKATKQGQPIHPFLSLLL
ncbi:hypothetical protein PCANC_20613 [Puccinia coronata f. sp. avenae]|uniref:Uncharacterized protein n=1 Tax=Puccinia coronata f. sp. avenae TaxID=200324 RepID=A0A2N5T4V6_9BASI|nr:hypothetical protein PCANC_20613 [Puccinia coronata f. sp. avenae]